MIDSSFPGVQIKGIRDGLLVTLGDGPWEELRAALLKQVGEQGQFFKGARLALDIGNQVLHAAELGSLRDILSDHGISLWAVLSDSPTTEQTAKVLGLATKIAPSRQERAIVNQEHLPGENAIMIRRTLRSGMRIEYSGHVFVFGDVNPGAEIVAGGYVMIWGRLRGSIHAGKNGDETAIIAALDMQPTQLRISECSATQIKKKGKAAPETARISDDAIVFEAWNP